MLEFVLLRGNVQPFCILPMNCATRTVVASSQGRLGAPHVNPGITGGFHNSRSLYLLDRQFFKRIFEGICVEHFSRVEYRCPSIDTRLPLECHVPNYGDFLSLYAKNSPTAVAKAHETRMWTKPYKQRTPVCEEKVRGKSRIEAHVNKPTKKRDLLCYERIKLSKANNERLAVTSDYMVICQLLEIYDAGIHCTRTEHK